LKLQYHAQVKAFVIPSDAFEDISRHIYAAMKGIREVAGLPMDQYEVKGSLSQADHAQQRLISLANSIGINLGSDWAHEIDLRNL